MSALAHLTRVEAKLFLRDTGAVVFGLVFPALLLVLLGGVMPGFREPADDLGGLRPIDIYLPVVITLALATVAFSTLPTALATYREKGVLRRLAITPVSPSKLLGAQVLVNLGAMAFAVILAVVLGVAVFDVPMPQQAAMFTGVFLLATLAMFAIGLLLAALVPTAKAASGIGMLVYFPMLFFAGVWTPGPTMPETVRRIGELTPLGAASQAMAAAWEGSGPAPLAIAVLVVYAVGVSALAARLFRWS